MTFKKIMIVLALLFFIGTGWFVVNKFRTIHAANNKPKTEKEAQKIAFYNQYSKQLGQFFTIDSIAIRVDSFDFVSTDAKTVLYCKLTLTNNSNQNQRLMAVFFALKCETEKIFYPEDRYRFLEPNVTKKQVLVYNLPPRILSYLNYWLFFESKTNEAEKAIISISKSYRSEG